MIHKCLISENKCQSLSCTKQISGLKNDQHQQGWQSPQMTVSRQCLWFCCCAALMVMKLLEEVEEEGGAEWFCYLSFNCLHKCNSTSRMAGCGHSHQLWFCRIKKSRNWADSNVGTRHQGFFFVNTKVGGFYWPARPTDDCWFSDRWKIAPMSELWTGNKIKHASGPHLLDECSKLLKSLWNWCLMLLFGHCSV